MSEYLLLKLNNKEVSVNPEFASANSDLLVQNKKTITVPMVSKDSIDTGIGDRVELSTKKNTQEVKNTEEPAWYEKLGASIEQSAKWVAIKANKLADIEAVHEAILEWELDDENNAAAADMSANSEEYKIRKNSAVFASRIENAKMQEEVALKQISEFDEAVKEGYAEQYHRFKPENQIKVAGAVAFEAKCSNTVEKVIQNSSKCAREVQAEVTGAIADGIVRNQNFDETGKTDMGVKLAKNVVNLDETQQAAAYEQVANKMNAYKKVVAEVQHQVVNVAKENVRNEAIARLQNSNYDNVKQAFSTEAVKKAQETFKAANGGNISTEQAKAIKKAVETDLKNAVEAGKTEAQKQITQERISKQTATKASNPFIKKLGLTTASSRPDTEKDVKYSDFTTRTQFLAVKYQLEECDTLQEFAKSIKKMADGDLKTILKTISPTMKKEMFTNTTSVYLQAFLLKSGVVDYEDVKNDCIPGINSQLEVFTLNHDIEYAIQRLKG